MSFWPSRPPYSRIAMSTGVFRNLKGGGAGAHFRCTFSKFSIPYFFTLNISTIFFTSKGGDRSQAQAPHLNTFLLMSFSCTQKPGVIISNSNRPSDFMRFERDWPIRKFSNRIGRACPLLVVSLVKRLNPTLSGTVYKLASSMSDHMTAV